jgi:hypothetical protein
MEHSHRLFKKLRSLLSSIRRIIQTRGHSCADPRGHAAIWVALNSVGSLCTPTLIHPDKAEGWLMPDKLRGVRQLQKLGAHYV